MCGRMHHIMNNKEHFKSGFVAVVGRPNVGKSTLINALIGDKIAIVSDKAQTTRNRIICVYTDEAKQIVFMDTPGVHKPKHKLGEFMVDAAIESLKETEAVLFVVAGNEKRGPGDNFIIEQLKRVKVPVFLVVNKIDTLKKEELLEAIVSYQDAYPFAGVIPISAKDKENLSEILKVLEETLPEGPQYFPEDMIISLERTREQAIEYGHSFERELAYLTTHSCLHILGYDHMNDEDKKEMRTEEEFILGNLGYVREDAPYNE